MGKDLIAEETASGVAKILSLALSAEGIEVRGWGGECFSWRALRVAGSTSAKESSEQANLTAPLKSPSSSFAETRAARTLMGSRGLALYGQEDPGPGRQGDLVPCLFAR